jgi:hypothetical protein
MKIKNIELFRRLGLPAEAAKVFKGDDDVLLTSSGTDPRSGLVAVISSGLTFNDEESTADYTLEYWRQLPYGVSKSQNLINISFAETGISDEQEIAQLHINGKCIYDHTTDDITDTQTKLKVHRSLEAISRVNTHIRNQKPVSDVARILTKECHLEDVTGESLVLRGLSSDGGFNFRFTADFAQAAAKKGRLQFTGVDVEKLKTIMGFQFNSVEPDKNYSEPGEACISLDPMSGITYEAGVEWKQSAKAKKCSMSMYVTPIDVPEGAEAIDIPEFLQFEFERTGEDVYELKSASFMGEVIDATNLKAIQSLIGLAQSANKDFAQDTYPAFMDSTAHYDLLDQINPLPTPKSLEKEGGELRYVSLHGSGHEKTVEHYGDQIGAGALFLQQGMTKDGKLDSVGVCVDFPFATGDTQSNWDGAVPDYLSFWDDIDSFFMTHDHFDHADGLAYYAKAGLMKTKTVYATPQVKYFLKEKMNTLKVAPKDRPKIIPIDEKGNVCVRDDEGNARLWVQYCPNGTSHSALTTPYIITGCYKDSHYNGSVAVYGDGNALTEKGQDFFAEGTAPLGKEEGVTPAKVKEKVTAVLHDPTAIRYEGHAPKPDDVENNLAEVFSWFDDKGVLFAPISTNHQEYLIGTNLSPDVGPISKALDRRLSLLSLA